jgi:hypothetical protein
MVSRKWIQHALRKHKSGALHKQLGIPMDQEIPSRLLERISNLPNGYSIETYSGHSVKITPLLKKRVNLALNLRNI